MAAIWRGPAVRTVLTDGFRPGPSDPHRDLVRASIRRDWKFVILFAPALKHRLVVKRRWRGRRAHPIERIIGHRGFLVHLTLRDRFAATANRAQTDAFAIDPPDQDRTEERRVGKERDSKVRYCWPPEQ